MDLVVPVRDHTRRGPEPLRWMLRTVHQHLPQVDRVVVVGHRPHWCQPDVWIHSPNNSTKFTNIGRHLEAALRSPDVADAFIWTNDDIFLLADLGDLPVYARGTIQAHLESARIAGVKLHDDFVDGIRRQAALAKLWGYDPATTLNADCHTPIPLDKDRLASVLERRDKDDPAIEGGHFRMLYGLGLECQPIRDPKVKRDKTPPADAVMVSTTTRSWESGVGETIRQRYRSPSPWEAY